MTNEGHIKADPEWADGTNCFRCRDKFGLFTRKHHCRACGQVFCLKCSDRYVILSHINAEHEVRVCERCYEIIKKRVSKEKLKASEAVKKEGRGSASNLTEQKLKAMKEAEEEQLQLAIALSQSEAEEKERQKQNALKAASGQGGNQQALSPVNDCSAKTPHAMTQLDPGGEDAGRINTSIDPDNNNPELAHYLNRSHWEKVRQGSATPVTHKEWNRNTNSIEGSDRKSPIPSAPPPSVCGSEISSTLNNSGENLLVEAKTGEASPDKDTEEFTKVIKSQAEALGNRIRSNQARGRTIVNDSGINTLFLSLTQQHAQILGRMQRLDDRKNQLEEMQDKLAQIQEARQAVDTLREEEIQKKEEALKEAERKKQEQIQAKLAVMRQKKHEMLERQRIVALQNMQQQQQDMLIRRQMQMTKPVPYQVYQAPILQQISTYPGHHQGPSVPWMMIDQATGQVMQHAAAAYSQPPQFYPKQAELFDEKSVPNPPETTQNQSFQQYTNVRMNHTEQSNTFKQPQCPSQSLQYPSIAVQHYPHGMEANTIYSPPTISVPMENKMIPSYEPIIREDPPVDLLINFD